MKNVSRLIGVDLGGTAIKYGVCDVDGVVKKDFISESNADEPPEIILNKVKESISAAMDYAKNEKWEISGIGIGTPGCVDIESGYLRGSTPNFKLWKDVAIQNPLESQFNIPVFVDNDANAMAYGEYLFGAGENCENAICITLGTGIGGGIIINQQLFRGSNYAGAELGHMSICHNGKRCRCGGIGCWELYASAPTMVENYRALHADGDSITPREIFDRYQNNDSVATKVINEEIKMVGAGLASLVNIFNPERIIIGGGLSDVGQWFIDLIAAEVEKRAMEQSFKSVEILLAKLGNKAGWLGAAALAWRQYLSD